MRRNLTRAEKEAVAKVAPRLNVKNWVIRKKAEDHYVLQHKETGRKKVIPV